MRKLTFGGATSLDNFLARADHSVDWLMWGKEAEAVMAHRVGGIDMDGSDEVMRRDRREEKAASPGRFPLPAAVCQRAGPRCAGGCTACGGRCHRIA